VEQINVRILYELKNEVSSIVAKKFGFKKEPYFITEILREWKE